MFKLLAVVLAVAVSVTAQAPKVKVGLYTESLCPGCISFSTGPLAKAMAANGLSDITDLRIIPFGNAKENPDKSFTCQHGVNECKGNFVMACGIYVGKNQTAWWPYILCLERGNPYNDGQKCAASAKLDWTAINACINDKNLSYDIMHKHQVETNALQPRKQYTPWVVLNDKPLYEDFNNMIQKICAAYTGPKPAGCNALAEQEPSVCPDEQF